MFPHPCLYDHNVRVLKHASGKRQVFCFSTLCHEMNADECLTLYIANGGRGPRIWIREHQNSVRAKASKLGGAWCSTPMRIMSCLCILPDGGQERNKRTTHDLPVFLDTNGLIVIISVVVLLAGAVVVALVVLVVVVVVVIVPVLLALLLLVVPAIVGIRLSVGSYV